MQLTMYITLTHALFLYKLQCGMRTLTSSLKTLPSHFALCYPLRGCGRLTGGRESFDATGTSQWDVKSRGFLPATDPIKAHGVLCGVRGFLGCAYGVTVKSQPSDVSAKKTLWEVFSKSFYLGVDWEHLVSLRSSHGLGTELHSSRISSPAL